MTTNQSKQKVVHAAVHLFYQKGFHGTSIREIAKKASVNVSLISYYFKGKQGLLEYTVIHYFERYLQIISNCLNETSHLLPLERLKQLVQSIIQYKHDYHQLSCFIHRELSFDSIFVREMAVTYIAKENFYISELFHNVLKSSNKNNLEKEYLMMQLKGMIATPFMLYNEFKHYHLNHYSKRLFIRKYTQTICDWLDFIVSRQN